MFKDWITFYLSAYNFRMGLNPYDVLPGSYNPYPLAVHILLAPTTFLPFSVWVWVMIAMSALGIMIICKRNTHWMWLSFPFIYGMYWGSLDVLLWVPTKLFGGIGLSLMTLKPQLGIVVIPLQLAEWYRVKNWKEIQRFGITSILLWIIPTVIWPGWIGEWLKFVPSLPERAYGSASLVGFDLGAWWSYLMLVMMCLTIFWLIIRKRNAYYLPMVFSPSFWASDWMITMEFANWKYTLLTWVCYVGGLLWGGAELFVLLPLFIAWNRLVILKKE